ncbi:MAG TPA: CBS domain-containing protein [Candidatus Hypogeohydataceae bacterium YC41]
MTKRPLVLGPEDGVRKAASLFLDKKFGAAPVVDKEGHLVGIISIIDILNTFSPDFLPLLKDLSFIKDYGALDIRVKDVRELEKTKVGDIMARNVITVDEDSDLLVAIALMRKNGFKHLPVVKGSKLIGIVSQTDVCRRFLEIWEGQLKGENS